MLKGWHDRVLHVGVALVASLAAMFGAVACSNVSRYVQGPQPVAARPAPEWTLKGPDALVEAFNTWPTLTFAATVVAVEPGTPPALGFKLHLKDISPVSWGASDVTITVSAWTAARPLTRSGTRVTVALTNGNGRELMVLDGNGLLFHGFTGEMFPGEGESGPLLFATTHEPSYYQAVQGRDLCGQTWVHSRMSVVSDLASTTLSPGERARIRGSHNGNTWIWLVASSDSSFLDESDCPGEYPPAVFFVVARETRAAEGADDFKGLKKITK